MDTIKTLPHIGIIGGTGWPSTNYYLEQIPLRVQKELGGLNSPNISFESRNFAQIDAWIHAGEWKAIRDSFVKIVTQMRMRSHIQAVAILSNTLHKVAEEVSEATGVPAIHIGDVTAKMVWGQCLDRVGFIGTKATMQDDFILKYFRQQGVEVFTPSEKSLDEIDRIIFKELCQKKFNDKSRSFLFRQVAEMIYNYDIEGVVLRCTELGLTMTGERWLHFCQRNRTEITKTCPNGLDNFPFVDATECHIDAIVAFCCRYAAV